VIEQAPPAPIQSSPTPAPNQFNTGLPASQQVDFQGNRHDTNRRRQEVHVAAPVSAVSPDGTAVVPPPGVTVSPNATSYAAKPPHKQPPVADEKGNWFESLLSKIEHFGQVELALLKAKIAQFEGKNTKDPVKP
jgi:hypothetical protein